MHNVQIASPVRVPLCGAELREWWLNHELGPGLRRRLRGAKMRCSAFIHICCRFTCTSQPPRSVTHVSFPVVWCVLTLNSSLWRHERLKSRQLELEAGSQKKLHLLRLARERNWLPAVTQTLAFVSSLLHSSWGTLQTTCLALTSRNLREILFLGWLQLKKKN